MDRGVTGNGDYMPRRTRPVFLNGDMPERAMFDEDNRTQDPTPTKKKRRKKRTDAMSWKDAVQDVYDCGFLLNVHDVADGVYVAADGPHGWNAAARELAQRLPGQVRPQSGGGGITWICGNSRDNPAPQGVIVDGNGLGSVLRARDTIKTIWNGDPNGGNIMPDNKRVWTLGACARVCVRFIGEPQEYEKNAERLIESVPYGYHDCKPGTYDYVEQYDVSAYYYNMLCRLPSLRVSVLHNDLLFHPMTADERERWQDIRDAVEECKPLRNSLAGACAGTLRRGVAYYYDSEREEVIQINPPGTPGAFRAAGLLLVRSGYELCREEALTVGSKYATIDSVTTIGGTPSVWRKHGFTAKLAASGPAHICHRGSYLIGQKQTVWYHLGYREPIAVEPTPEPGCLYSKLWL